LESKGESHISRIIGRYLPRPVLRLVSSKTSRRKNVAIPLLTTDEETRNSRVCLLCPYEIVSLDSNKNRLFFSVYADSTTNKNLVRTKKAILLIPCPPRIYYVLGKLRKVASFETIKKMMENVYSMDVVQVSEDYAKQAPIKSQLTFDETKIKQYYARNYRTMLKIAE
jgi:hypothetical protein